MAKPSPSDFAEYFQHYINLVKENTIMEALHGSCGQVISVVSQIPDTKGTFRYAPEKWSINDLMLHLIDTERIFTYRALSIARQDATPLPGYDHNEYVNKAKADLRSLEQLLEEFKALRQSTIDFFGNLTPDMLNQKGRANDLPLSVQAIGFIIPGHCHHHINILTERYLPNM